MRSASGTAIKSVSIDYLIRLTKSHIASLESIIRKMNSEANDFKEVGRPRNSAEELLQPMQAKKKHFDELLKRFIISRARGTRMVDTPITLLFILEQDQSGVS